MSNLTEIRDQIRKDVMACETQLKMLRGTPKRARRWVVCMIQGTSVSHMKTLGGGKFNFAANACDTRRLLASDAEKIVETLQASNDRDGVVYEVREDRDALRENLEHLRGCVDHLNEVIGDAA